MLTTGGNPLYKLGQEGYRKAGYRSFTRSFSCRASGGFRGGPQRTRSTPG